jgi:ABC-type molybdate transport system substrate-binding protein
MIQARPWAVAAIFAAGASATSLARAQAVEVFSAGSLRGVVADLGKAAQSAFHIEVKPTFGGSGSLRERIEKGEKPDLLMSADLGSPRKLAADGRTVVPVIAFARNRMCIVSRRSAGVTPTNLIDHMLAKGVRIRTSTPIVDPSGDYAWAIFDRIDSMRPGTGALLKDKAQSAMSATVTPATPNQSAAAALFAARQIDMSITYCSATPALEKELPELTSLPVPPRLDPHPVYGIAVLSDRPEVMRLVLLLLSDKGQEIIARAGLVPLLEAPAAQPVRGVDPCVSGAAPAAPPCRP